MKHKKHPKDDPKEFGKIQNKIGRIETHRRNVFASLYNKISWIYGENKFVAALYTSRESPHKLEEIWGGRILPQVPETSF